MGNRASRPEESDSHGQGRDGVRHNPRNGGHPDGDDETRSSSSSSIPEDDQPQRPGTIAMIRQG